MVEGASAERARAATKEAALIPATWGWGTEVRVFGIGGSLRSETFSNMALAASKSMVRTSFLKCA